MQNKQLMTSAGKLAGLMAAASVGSLAVAFSADAASMLLFSDSDSFADELTELEGMPSLTVDKYTPAPGFVITEVQVMLTAELDSEGTVTNTAAQAQSFTASNLVFQFDVVPGVGAPGALATLNPYPPGALICSQNYMNLAPNSPAPFGPCNLAGMDSDSYFGGDIAGFLGAGTFSMDPFTTIFTGFSGGGGNTAANIQTLAGATLTVKYFGMEVVTSTPEPSALLGLGLIAGLGFASTKRRSK